MICQHKFTKSTHPDYEECEICGTYHSTLKIDRAALYLDEYWSGRHGHSTIDEQVHNVAVHKENGLTKNDFVLDQIHAPYMAISKSVIEIGCAPGNLLDRLHSFGFHTVTGLESDPAYEADIRRIGKHDGPLIFGMFPESTKRLDGTSADVIIGLDIIEHVDDPKPFLAECHRLLKPGGQLLLMTPLASSNLPERMFHPEHVWIFSTVYMVELLTSAGFGYHKFAAWCPGHETVSAIKI